MQVLHLFQSDGHNYVGHHGHPPGTNTTEEVEQMECVAGSARARKTLFRVVVDCAQKFYPTAFYARIPQAGNNSSIG